MSTGLHCPPALLGDIEAIYANSKHLSKLVDDVLDLSQVEAGRMALGKEWTRLPETIRAAALAVGPLFQAKDLYLETECERDLPQVWCDSTRIRQVMLNLLSNAGRYTERGGVHVRAWRAREEVIVSVTDTGPGITAPDMKKLFEPFQQLDGSTRRRHGGSGLGLSISRQFVEMHRGKMWVESQPGRGTAFFFSLPLEAGSPTPADDGVLRWFHPDYSYQARTRRSKAVTSAAVPRFVLLERGQTLQRLFSRQMETVETVAAHTIEDAVDELSRSPARALVVNAAPFGEPLATKEQLAHLPYGTPAITCWAPGEEAAAERLGVVRYLTKPVGRETLACDAPGVR